jgi:hypothetical protein
MAQPTTKTIKRLFALSGNQCAFPGCTKPLVEEGTVIGEICHIKAQSTNGPRSDPAQHKRDRHAFENLILMCHKHHKIVDDNPETYTVEMLLQYKAQHEAQHVGGPEPSDDVVQQILAQPSIHHKETASSLVIVAVVSVVAVVAIVALLLHTNESGTAVTSSCPVTAPTDEETFDALISREERAVERSDVDPEWSMVQVKDIFDPAAEFHDVGRGGPPTIGPITHYERLFREYRYCDIRYDWGSKDVDWIEPGAEAAVSIVTYGSWGPKEEEGCRLSIPGDHVQWHFRKDANGCWRIIKFFYNNYL